MQAMPLKNSYCFHNVPRRGSDKKLAIFGGGKLAFLKVSLYYCDHQSVFPDQAVLKIILHYDCIW